MKPQNIPVRILAALFVCAATQLSAEAALPTIELVTTFGVNPGQGVDTRPNSINSNGDIAGYIVYAIGGTQGFVRLRDGTYSIIVNPNGGNARRTTVRAINDSGLIAGDYRHALHYFGFFLSGGTFTDFTLPHAFSTFINSLNNAGDFAGTVDFPNGDSQPYISVGGNVTYFSIPGAFSTSAGGINNLNQVAGSYLDPPTRAEGPDALIGAHGYIRDADGTLTFPIDYPGAAQTVLAGINDKGWMAGYYVDTRGVTHGLFLNPSTGFVVFDFPESTFTILTGINNQGTICGYYLDPSSVVLNGLVARAVLSTAE